MREILFRGKRVDNGEWAEGYYVVGVEYGDNGGVETGYCETATELHFITPKEGEISLVIPETIGQFTGLVDKNSKKIFEGDIVTNGDSVQYRVEYWDINWSGFVLTDANETWEDYLGNCDDIEIIGSIHDKGELINE